MTWARCSLGIRLTMTPRLQSAMLTAPPVSSCRNELGSRKYAFIFCSGWPANVAVIVKRAVLDETIGSTRAEKVTAAEPTGGQASQVMPTTTAAAAPKRDMGW